MNIYNKYIMGDRIDSNGFDAINLKKSNISIMNNFIQKFFLSVVLVIGTLIGNSQTNACLNDIDTFCIAAIDTSGGVGIVNYNWSTSSGGATVTQLPGDTCAQIDWSTAATGNDTVILIVTNACGADTTYYPVFISDTLSITSPLATCASNGTEYTLSFTANSGTSPYTVSGSGAPGTWAGTTWTSGPIPAGTAYSISVTDANMCNTVMASGASPVCDVCASTTITLNITSTDPSNINNNNGTATVTASGGLIPYSYLWSDPAMTTTATVSNLTPGTYNVTVTDSNGCTATQSVVINPFSCNAVIDITFTQTNVACFGGNTGSATASAVGGTAPYSYSWSNGQTVATATNLSAGVYTVTVTDFNGCTASESVVITQPSAGLTASATTLQNQLTVGGTEGSVTASGAGGTLPYTYLWTGPGGPYSGQTVSGLLPGTYCVTVTDVNNCTSALACATVAPVSCTSPNVSFTTVNVTCNGSSNGAITTTVTGGSQPFSYSWSNGDTTASLSGLSAGTYTLILSDNNSCTYTYAVTITQPATLSAGIAVSNVGCYGAATGSLDLTVSGGVQPYTFDWNNLIGAANPEDQSNLTAGTYNVVVTDANGCTVNASATISQPTSALTVNITKTNATFSNGCSDGTATVSASGGTSPYTYSWLHDGSTNATASNLDGPDTYTVTVTDANGCELTQSVTIDCVNDCDAVVAIDNITNVLCNGGNTGSATVSATSAAHPGGPFNFVWKKAGVTVYSSSGTTSTLANATAGSYTVSVTIQGTQCQAVEQTVSISEPVSSVSVSASTLLHQQTVGGTEGSVTASATGGTGPYTYAWTPGGATTQTVTGLLPGTYCVTVTDANGCTSPQACTIVNPYTCSSSPVVTPTVSNVTCNGGSNGAITLSVNGGMSPYTYSWTGTGVVATAQNQSGLTAGTYTVTVTDANGCQSQTTITVTQPNPLSAAIAVTNIGCYGAATGALNLTVTGGTGPYAFNWDNLAAASDPEDQTGLTAGTYNVVVTDANGCTVNASATISQPTSALTVNITKTNATFSNGCSDGTATVSASGGTSPYTYSWLHDGSTNATASNLDGPDTYTVTVTDANGCELTQSVTIDCVNDCDAVVAIDNITNVLCNGGNTGSATVSATSAAHPGGPFNFVWKKAGVTVYSSSGTTSTLANATAGSYTVSVTIQGTQCQAVEQTVSISEPVSSVSVSASTLLHQQTVGGTEGSVTASATGGTGPYTYAWTPGGATTQTVTGLLPGTYCVTVTDANGCTSPQACTIVNPYTCSSSPVVTPTVSNVTCNGGSNGAITLSVNGGMSPYTYSWTGTGVVATAQNQSGLTAGTYTVTVTDANGCQSQTTITVTQPNPLSAAIAVTNIGCYGAATGALNLTVTGGTGPYAFNWDNLAAASDPEDQTGLTAGTYNVVVTDANGCTVNASATISQPTSALTVNITKTNATFSNGCSDGTATVSASGGTSPYTYSWLHDGSTNATASNLDGPDTYTVTVTDANGCELTQSVTIDCVNDCDAVVAIDNITNVLCNGGNTGSATVSATSAAHPGGPFNFVWKKAGVTVYSSSGTTSTLANATAGSYTVSVTIQGTQCQAVEQTVSISEPVSSVSVSASTLLHQQTVGGTEGSVTASATGGTGPYTYAWTPGGATTQTVTGLLPGTYCVTVTDANGCTSPQACTIVNPYTCSSSPVVTPTVSNVTCNGGSNGAITLSVNGGMSPYTYSWTGTGVVATAQNQSGLTAGTYTVTVTDANGCQSQTTITVTQPNPLSAAIAVTNIGCYGAATGALNLTVTGGTGPYAFNWDNLAAASDPEDQTGLTAGTYNVVVTDANGCTVNANATISQPNNPLTINVSTVSATTTGGCINGEAFASVSGGTAPYTFAWDNSSTADSAFGLTGSQAGVTHTVTITDANGCSKTESFVMNCGDDCDASISLASSTNVSCNGGNDGSATVNASSVNNPTAEFTFVWTDDADNVVLITNADTTSTVSNLAAGVYSVSVTMDGTACDEVQATVSITEPINPVSANAVTLQNQQTVGGSEGQATVNAIGGSGSYTYAWTGPSSYTSANQTITGLTPGTYCVVVTDGNGCAASQVCTTIDPVSCANSTLTATANVQNVLCNGDATGQIVISANGGQPNYTYEWANSTNTTPTNSGLVAGTYSVTVHDALNCTFTLSTTISQPSPLSAGMVINNATCEATADGSINLTVAGGTFPYMYSWSNGQITEDITGLVTNEYCVTITDANGCTFNKCDSVNAAPPSSISNVVVLQQPDCGLVNGSIQIQGLFPSTQYELEYNFNSGYVYAGIFGSSGTGTITLNSLSAGVYENFVVTDQNTGCPSAPFAGPVTLTEGNLPQLTASNVTITNPTTCTLCNGSIRISGVDSTVNYSILYSIDGLVISSPYTATSTATGTITIPNLCQGTYDDFVITESATGCSFNPITGGPFVLSGPNGPAIVSNGITTTDPTNCGLCNGTLTIQLDVASLGSPLYTVMYSLNGATATTISNLSANASNQIVLTGLCGGSYANIKVSDANSCSSSSVAGPFVLTTPTVLSVGAVTTVNPSVCNVCDGKINIGGLTPNTVFNVTYTDPSGNNGSINNLTSSGTGVLQMNSLCDGSYTLIVVTNPANGCSTDPIGPVTLTDPGAPMPSGITAITNPSTCSAADGRFTITGLTAGTSYTVQYDNPSAATITTMPILASAAGSITVTGLDNGTYSNIIVISPTGCQSLPLGPVTLSDPSPVLGTVEPRDTICLGQSYTLMISPQVAPPLNVNWRRLPLNNIISAQSASNGSAPYPDFPFVVTPVNTTSYAAEMINPTSGCTYIDTITVFVEKAPVLVADGCFVTDEDVAYSGSISGDLSSNDNYADVLSGDVTFTLVSINYGSLSINNSTNSFVYTPTLNFVGQDTAVVQVCNTACPSLCNTTTICFTVVPVIDTVPQTTCEDCPITLCSPDVFTDTTNMTNNIVLSCGPSNGTIDATDVSDGCFTYTPSTNYVGQDTLCVVLCNNAGVCDTTIIPITVTPVTDTIPLIVDEDDSISVCTPVLTDMGPGATFETCSSTLETMNGTLSIVDSCVTYYPNENYNGPDEACIVVCNNGVCDTTILIIDVLPVNDPPVAVNDINNTTENTPVIGSVATNDYDIDGDSLIFTANTTGLNDGTIIFNPDGTYIFTPDSGFVGTVEIPYAVCDTGMPVLCADAVLVIEVIENDPYAHNNPPVANNDNVVVTGTDPVELCIVCNDEDPDGDDLGIPTLLDQPTSGTVTIDPVTGVATYTPDPTLEPLDTTVTFTYYVCDNGVPSLCDTATVTIDVNPMPEDSIIPPFAADDAYGTPQNVPVMGNVSDNDLNQGGGPVTFTVTDTSTLEGTLTSFDPVTGEFTFEPTPDYVGPTSFTYELCDTAGNCSEATVYITIFDDNEPPVAVDDINNTPENTPVDGSVATNDTDANDNPLTFTADTTGLTDGTIVFNPDGTYTFTPDSGFVGTVEIPYTVCDDAGLCDEGVLVIEVIENDPLADNNPPVANNDNVVVTGTDPVELCIVCNDEDPDGDDLGIPTLLDQPTSGTVTIDPVTGVATYTPDPTLEPLDTTVTFTYYVCDNGVPSLCDTATVTIDVNPMPEDSIIPPFAADDAYGTPQNVPVMGNVSDNDLNQGGGPVTFTVTDTSTLEGTLTSFDPVTGEFTFEPTPDYVGPTSFTYELCDTAGNCSEATVYITIFDDNEPPVAVDDINNTLMDTPVDGSVATNDTDPNDDPLTFTPDTSMLTDGVLEMDSTTGEYTFTPNTGFIGTVEIPYTVCDDAGLCDEGVLVIEVIENDPLADNNPPVANNDNVVVTGTDPVELCIVCNDEDPDGDDLGIPTLLDQPTSGTVTIDPVTGVATYTPDPTLEPLDTTVTFTYYVCDNGVPSLCDTATVTIDVNPMPEDSIIPPFAADDAYGTPQNVPVMGNVSDNDLNQGGGPVTFTVTDTSTLEGTLTSFDPVTGEFTFEPTPGYVGPTSFTYELCDTAGNCSEATVYITIFDDNEPPVAVDDINNTPENTPVDGSVATNDTDANDDPLTFTPDTSMLTDGVLEMDSTTGEYTFTPNTGFIGTVEIPYTVCDDAGLCDEGVLVIEVIENDPLADNNPPVANNDNVVVTGTDPVELCIVCNDEDPDGDDLGIPTLLDQPTSGTVTIDPVTGVATYTPDPTLEPLDTTVTFTYYVCDNGVPSLCDTATVTIDVNPMPEDSIIPPFAADDAYGTPQNVPVMGNVSDNDLNQGGGPVTFTVTDTSTLEGTLTSFDPVTGEFTFEPTPDYVGPTSFTYELCDTAGNCSEATVYITIFDDNEPPVAVDDINNTPENTPVDGSVATNDTDANDDPLTFTADTTGLTDGTIVFNPDGTYTFTPDSGFVGTVEIPYTVCDDAGLCDEGVLVIEVIENDPLADNNPPVANNDNVVVTGTDPVELCIVCNDEDPDGDDLGIPTLLDQPTSGTVTIDPVTGVATYTPDPTLEPLDTTVTFTYYVCDNGVPSLCDTATVTIDVNPMPEDSIIPPFAADDAYGTPQNVPVMGNVSDNDLNQGGGPVTFTVTDTSTLEGTLTSFDPVTGEFTFEPTPGYVGPTSFTYELCDTAGNCSEATVYITIFDDNEPPLAINDVNHTFNDLPVSGDVSTNDTDPNGDPLTYTQLTDPQTGNVSFNPDGTYTYTPEPGDTGTVSFDYVVCDPYGLCDTATVVIDVDIYNPNVNNGPIAINDNTLTEVNTPVTVCIVCNDSDPDGDDLSDPVITSQPSNGTVVVNPDGTVTYTPNTDFIGEDQFTYVVCDADGLCDEATVTVIVTSPVDPTENHTPVAVDDHYTTNLNTPVNGDESANDYDPDGDDLTYSVVDEPMNGTVVPNQDGTFTYTPSNGFAGEDQFTYVACDDNGACDTATVYVTVLPAPIDAVNDTAKVPVTAPFDPITIEVLNNDTTSGTPTISIVTNPEEGTVTINPDGTITYTPPASGAINPLDSFQYVICLNTLCDTAWVYIDLPAGGTEIDAVDDFREVEPGTPTVISVLDNDNYTVYTDIYVVEQPTEGTVTVNSDGTITYSPNGTFVVDYFTYALCNEDLCDTATVMLISKFPDGISPNGDGINDNFDLGNILRFFPDATLAIYNRWGDEVWSSYGPYHNDWNGVNYQNVNLPDGTYFYIFDFNNENYKPKQGFVAIYRNK